MLSLLINHYKSPVALKLCLRSIRESLEAMPHEVIVADSAAQRTTQRMLAEYFPEANYIPFEENVGFAKLVNAGVQHAHGDFLFILNADTMLVPGTTETLMEYLAQHPDVGMVGPRLEYQNGQHQPSAFRFYTPFVIVARRTLLGKTRFGKRALDHFMLRDIIREPVSITPPPSHGEEPETNPGNVVRAATPIALREPIAVDWLMGSALMVRRQAVEDVGLLDERFFLYFEDVDWCRRFWEKGWRVVWVPSVRVIHVHAQASRKRGGLFDIVLNPYTRIHLVSAIRYFRKYGLRTPRYGV